MTLQFTKLGSQMGVAAEGVDLNGAIDGATAQALRNALLENLVLCIRAQKLAPKEYYEAMRGFGVPAMQVVTRPTEIPEVAVLSSDDRDERGDGRRIVVGAHWHTDDSYRAVPCSLTMLYGVAIPPTGGDTQFVNMYAAYEDLASAMKERIAGLRVVHVYDSSRKGTAVRTRTEAEKTKTPDVVHPLVRTHPETARKALYLNPNRMEEIVGMARAASDALLDELIAHATQPRYQYRHRWHQGDLVIWDNRCTMHKANADYPEGATRLMHRVMVEGTVPV